MRTCCIAQGTQLSALWWPKWEGNPKKRGYMYMYIADSLYCTAETNTVKQPIKIVKQHCKATILQ